MTPLTYPLRMRVQVLFFGGLRETLSQASTEVIFDAPPGSAPVTVADVERRLSTLHPAFATLRISVRVAVNETLIDGGEVHAHRLFDGDVVAFIPPVSGG